MFYMLLHTPNINNSQYPVTTSPEPGPSHGLMMPIAAIRLLESDDSQGVH